MSRVIRRRLDCAPERCTAIQFLTTATHQEQSVVHSDAEADHRHCVLREHAYRHDPRKRQKHRERNRDCPEREDDRQSGSDGRAEHEQQHQEGERYADTFRA